jgi:hypothetical protein
MPIYDYLYNTIDPITDDLHSRVRLQGTQLRWLLLPASSIHRSIHRCKMKQRWR